VARTYGAKNRTKNEKKLIAEIAELKARLKAVGEAARAKRKRK